MSLQLSHLRRRAGDLRRDGRQHLVLSPRSLGDLEIAQAQLVKAAVKPNGRVAYGDFLKIWKATGAIVEEEKQSKVKSMFRFFK